MIEADNIEAVVTMFNAALSQIDELRREVKSLKHWVTETTGNRIQFAVKELEQKTSDLLQDRISELREKSDRVAAQFELAKGRSGPAKAFELVRDSNGAIVGALTFGK
jgi:lysyl-tRNA synthetase class I